MTEPTIYELSQSGRKGFQFPAVMCRHACRMNLFGITSISRTSELEPHCATSPTFQNLLHIDGGFYPLGSCTMKYNPKINEVATRLPGFANTHPFQPMETVQGNLYVMYQLQEWLQEISGFYRVCLTPAAGAHGELVGAMIIKKYHALNNDEKRVKILIPDSAHGTNPATSSMSGFKVKPLPSDAWQR